GVVRHCNHARVRRPALTRRHARRGRIYPVFGSTRTFEGVHRAPEEFTRRLHDRRVAGGGDGGHRVRAVRGVDPGASPAGQAGAPPSAFPTASMALLSPHQRPPPDPGTAPTPMYPHFMSLNRLVNAKINFLNIFHGLQFIVAL